MTENQKQIVRHLAEAAHLIRETGAALSDELAAAAKDLPATSVQRKDMEEDAEALDEIVDLAWTIYENLKIMVPDS